MTITLSPEVEKLIQEKVDCGDYDSPQDLVAAAVQRLFQEDAEEAVHREAIQARLAAADAEIDRGEYVECDADTVDRLTNSVHRRGIRRAAEARKSGTRA